MRVWPLNIFLPLFLISCEKELDFQYHYIAPILVIEGRLTQNGAKISLTETTPMDEKMNTVRITDAFIDIKDLEDGGSYTLTSDSEGFFIADFPVSPWHNYTLIVNSHDKHYETVSTMYPAVEITDLNFNWIQMPYDMVALLNISFKELKEKNVCYWTRIYKNGTPYKWQLSHGSGAIDGILTQSLFTTRKNPDDENDRSVLHNGDELEVVVTGISLELYDYLTAIQNNSNGQSMFTGDFCLGYFNASQEATASIIFFEE